ncbi:formate dehydrogenase subunit gamma [Nitrospirillum sp. BR 11828]|uniref:formate dehydrogenase subunit gamma n=1 Tax=Nitrospirillum sp. BR 11828 TaxID=3104325 RepID=UPI002ACA80BC|nr:formate dehydrogenase subunit gamma [Nitrospirillum sp. BR 11828]MDZ5648622.1 formate dehydrogenase subunit gamma [Nitrospirillum sp. BR 11828]
MSYPKGTLVRNSTATRLNHWITGICFVLLTLSGLAMFHPVFFWLSNLFGSGQWMRAVHPWLGVTLLVSFIGLFVQFWRDNLWNRDDTAWAKKLDRVMANDEEHVPPVGRFNAGQKVVFWGMALIIPVLFVTGILIWEVYFGAATSIETQRAAVLIHSMGAIGAILIWITHVYAAIWVKGSMRAMLHGWVTPGWAHRHHRKWFRGLVASGSPGPTPNSTAKFREH